MVLLLPPDCIFTASRAQACLSLSAHRRQDVRGPTVTMTCVYTRRVVGGRVLCRLPRA